MPERSFGRTVRYRRTKLGLSQAKLGELVGRSTATIRSWERDKSRPTDDKVLGALAAILGIDQRQLFEKADVELPVEVESSPTVEQALATLKPAEPVTPQGDDELSESEPQEPEPQEPEPREEEKAKHLVAAGRPPAYAAPPEPYVRTELTPTLSDASYIEDPSQRQIYRLRTLATLVAVVALVVAFIWAFNEGLGALGEWWDSFFGQLRL